MPAALKTPLLESDLAPDNAARATPRRSVSPAASAASVRAETSARVPSRPLPRSVDREGGRAEASSRDEGASARKASGREARHRQFRPSITAMLCGCALVGQLVLLLWLHGNTLTAAREVEKVDAQIAEVSNDIERVQERVAAFDSSPQVKQWAAEKGWNVATPHDFDDVTKVEQARAMAQAEAARAQSEQSAQSAGEAAQDGQSSTQGEAR